MPYRDGVAPFYWWASDEGVTDDATPLGVGRSIPRVESAVAIDQTHVRVTYSQEVKHASASNSDDSLNPANYAFPAGAGYPLTAASVTLHQANPTIVDVAIAESEMTLDASYRVTVSNVQSLMGDVLSATYNYGDFSGIGVKPQVASATRLSGALIQVDFNEAMRDNAALVNAANYTFPVYPVGPPAAPLTPDVITKMSATRVEVTVLGEMKTGVDNYQVEVANVEDAFWNPIDTANDRGTFSGLGVAPQVASAVATDSTHVRVWFDEQMYENAAIKTISRYLITGPTTPTVSGVAFEDHGPGNPSSVLLTCTEMRDGGAYTVAITISTGIYDAVGNTLNFAHMSADFTGIGVGPEISSIAWVAEPPLTPTIRVVFSENMGAAGLLDPDNYEVLGGPLPVDVVDVDPWIIGEDSVALTLGGGEMKIGASYSLRVYDVVDKAGNTITPNPDSMAFLGKGVRPQVSAATLLDATHIRVTFNEAMKVETALTLKTNYGVAGPSVIEVDSVAVVVGSGDTQVDLEVTGDFVSGDYTVTVNSVRDLAENTIDPAGNTGEFTVVEPATISAKGYTSNLSLVRVTYTKDMKMVSPANPDDALNPANYSFTGGVAAVSVLEVTARIVDVLVTGQTRGHSYTVDVDNVEDTDGQPVAPNARSTYFIGADAAGGIEGLSPRTISRNYVSGNGGHPVEMLGEFPTGEPLRIYVGPTGTVDDPACYSGVAGQGKDIYAIAGTKVRFYTPPLPIGGPYTITIQVVGSGAVMRWTGMISALPPDYRSGVFSLRSLLPPIYKAGARKAEDLPDF